MGLLSIEHSRRAYRADFALHAGGVLALGCLLATAAPHALRLQLGALAGVGLLGWTLAEYALHRFVLHGVPPFKRWHAEHHARPTALICAPTVLSATLLAAFVFAPAWWLAGPWQACALTLGLSAGYLAYAVTHHATHHWRGGSAWLKQCKRRHALHHHAPQASRAGLVGQSENYGVTTAFWDRVFRSQGPQRAARGWPRWVRPLPGTPK